MKQLLIYIFSKTTNDGFTLIELETKYPKQIKHINHTIKLLIDNKLLAKKNKTGESKKYILLNHNPSQLYKLLNINYEIENYTEIETSSNTKKEYLYAYYYPAYKELAYYNETHIYPIKIGYTSSTYPLIRIAEQLGTSTPENPTVAFLIKIPNAKKLENAIHNYFKIHDKNIKETPNKEWFNTNTQELKNIINALISN